jgi:excisionase family DNA binding protein
MPKKRGRGRKKTIVRRSYRRERFLTAAEAALYLHIHPKSVYLLCARHELPYMKLGKASLRIDRLALDDLIKVGALVSPEQVTGAIRK